MDEYTTKQITDAHLHRNNKQEGSYAEEFELFILLQNKTALTPESFHTFTKNSPLLLPLRSGSDSVSVISSQDVGIPTKDMNNPYRNLPMCCSKGKHQLQCSTY
ncbi:hypothetical protein POM88_038013 [Heracleum sosnowskyi]|uniref:Uncharacterized protein n=1 Tax=Heracleum sosnowskyi TaxID=360622 RepID=A0AAD8HS85_9APIA|nr:hypothetical protein POM88_038013 [Heracleum sosnowskyi]